MATDISGAEDRIYYVDTVGRRRNQKRIEGCIRNQLYENCNADQLSLFEPVDPLTGKPTSTGKRRRVGHVFSFYTV